MRLRALLEAEGLVRVATDPYWVAMVKALPKARKVPAKGNELEAYVGQFQDATVYIARLQNFCIAKMGWGEVDFGRLATASEGLVEASGNWSNANPRDWRVGGVLPGGRRSARIDANVSTQAGSLFKTLYKFKSKVNPDFKSADDIASEYLAALRAVPAPERWMRYKGVRVDGSVISALHGFIPREFRHPDEYFDEDDDWADESEIPGMRAYEDWEDASGRVMAEFQRRYPDYEFFTEARF